MSNLNRQPIAILGGMGPDASARLYQLMIELSRSDFGVEGNHQYPEIIIDSIPVPEFFSNTAKAEEATFMLKDRVRKLNYLQPGCFGLACNTAHTTLADLEQETKAPFISIPHETAKEVKIRGYSKIGLLAAPTTIFAGVYQTELLNQGVEFELPDNSYFPVLSEIIGQVIGGEFKAPKAKLLKIADTLKKKKVEAIILGCTELPLVFPKNYSLPVLDTLEILAKSLLTRYYKGESI